MIFRRKWQGGVLSIMFITEQLQLLLEDNGADVPDRETLFSVRFTQRLEVALIMS